MTKCEICMKITQLLRIYDLETIDYYTLKDHLGDLHDIAREKKRR
jgi:hypothetical protein